MPCWWQNKVSHFKSSVFRSRSAFHCFGSGTFAKQKNHCRFLSGPRCKILHLQSPLDVLKLFLVLQQSIAHEIECVVVQKLFALCWLWHSQKREKSLWVLVMVHCDCSQVQNPSLTVVSWCRATESTRCSFPMTSWPILDLTWKVKMFHSTFKTDVVTMKL